MTEKFGYVTGYGMKGILNARVEYDDIFILPRRKEENENVACPGRVQALRARLTIERGGGQPAPSKTCLAAVRSLAARTARTFSAALTIASAIEPSAIAIHGRSLPLQSPSIGRH